MRLDMTARVLLIPPQAAKAYQQGIADGGVHPMPTSPLPVPRFAKEPGSVKCYSQTDEDGVLLYCCCHLTAFECCDVLFKVHICEDWHHQPQSRGNLQRGWI